MVETKKTSELDGLDYVNEAMVQRVRGVMPPEAHVLDMADTFKVLGDPTRLKLCWALAHGELCVGDLAALIHAAPSVISNHLRLLRGQKLVTYRKQGKVVFYRLADEHIEHLMRECQGHVAERVPEQAQR